MRDVATARRLLRLARALVSGEVVLATNESYWGWEYDTNIRIATLSLDENSGQLNLTITEEQIKSGLGAGRRKQTLFDGNVGTLSKPKLSTVNQALAKFSHERSRAGYPFRRNTWAGQELGGSAKMKLAEVIQLAVAKYGAATAGPAQDPRMTLMERIKAMSPREAERALAQLGFA